MSEPNVVCAMKVIMYYRVLLQILHCRVESPCALLFGCMAPAFTLFIARARMLKHPDAITSKCACMCVACAVMRDGLTSRGAPPCGASASHGLLQLPQRTQRHSSPARSSSSSHSTLEPPAPLRGGPTTPHTGTSSSRAMAGAVARRPCWMNGFTRALYALYACESAESPASGSGRGAACVHVAGAGLCAPAMRGHWYTGNCQDRQVAQQRPRHMRAPSGCTPPSPTSHGGHCCLRRPPLQRARQAAYEDPCACAHARVCHAYERCPTCTCTRHRASPVLVAHPRSYPETVIPRLTICLRSMGMAARQCSH